ncbi:MAG TPA: isocitrate lyase/phosphoenolpyruvate mutase family protein, partial [Solirubrobacterales bacterium]|nr:isocitrate lyase/phosphoenolpyruvate mutase family protein [Solirubrobacterales bacterium]
DLPVSVDLENGFGAAPEHVARAIEAVAAVGAVGGSIEDWDAEHGIYEPGAAAERIAAAAAAARELPFPFTLGRPDGGVGLDEVLRHVEQLTEVSELPVSVDLENGYGAAPEQAARAIEAVAAVGAVGGSIEDWDEEHGIYEVGAAAERIAAAAAVARELPFPFLLTGRAENHIRGNPDLDDTIARLRAYEAAGADVLYAPGLANPREVAAVVAAVERPLNVLARPTLSVAEIAGAGARRISVGGSLAWAAIEAMAEVATRMREDGDLSGLRGDAKVEGWLAG